MHKIDKEMALSVVIKLVWNKVGIQMITTIGVVVNMI